LTVVFILSCLNSSISTCIQPSSKGFC
jgi:hypothetical protein